jgi:signal transduction histidine kinase
VKGSAVSSRDPIPTKPFTWSGFTLQFFLVAILPLSVMLLLVAFGSQSLHHEAMRSLVGDRDLRTVRAAASSLEREIAHLSSTLHILSRSLGSGQDLLNLILSPLEISSTYDGGIALFTRDGDLVDAIKNNLDWGDVPDRIHETIAAAGQTAALVVYSPLVRMEDGQQVVFAAIQTDAQTILVGAFSPSRLVADGLGNLDGSGQISLLVVSPAPEQGEYDVLFHGGPLQMDESTSVHPGIREALNGKSGINYYMSPEGEHVVAYTPIASTGWGLVIEEAWEDIASPFLMTTQSAPLVIVPVFVLALFAIGFGARRIVRPLQRLEKQAALLAGGDFSAIRRPVGGIEEIRNLQSELIEMADKLNAAQQNLRGYIGAITASVETERRSLARELHDDTIQALIALNQRIQLILMSSSAADKNALTELQALVQQSMTNLRRMIRGLRPIYLEDIGLVASLEMLAKELAQASGQSIAFEVTGQPWRFNAETEMSLYRMVQESLNNVVRHARANHAWVEIHFDPDQCDIQVRDDGQGFTAPANSADFPKQGHFGLMGLHERAELIDASLEIDSRRGKGTTIRIRIANPQPAAQESKRLPGS